MVWLRILRRRCEGLPLRHDENIANVLVREPKHDNILVPYVVLPGEIKFQAGRKALVNQEFIYPFLFVSR